MRKHLFPHLVPTIIVYATLGVASSILIEASLSFLGIGVPLPEASWGQMIEQGKEYFQIAPWLLFAPGVCLVLTVLAFNLAGDWLARPARPDRPGAPQMTRVLIRRIPQTIIVLLGVVTLAFLLDPHRARRPGPADRGPERQRRDGRVDPPPARPGPPLWYQYGPTSARLLHGNLGTSYALQGTGR